MGTRKLFLSLKQLMTHISENKLADDGTELYCLECTQGHVTVLSHFLIRDAALVATTGTQSSALDLAMSARRAVLGAMTEGRALWRKELTRDSQRATEINATDFACFLSRNKINFMIPDARVMITHAEIVDLAHEQRLALEIFC
jgi:hypothetical protein